MRRIVLELTSQAIRALSTAGTLTRPTVRAFVVQPVADEVNANALRQAVAGLPTRGAEILSIIPREQVIIRLLKLPSTDPDELAQMVELTGKAQLPYPPDQTIVDFQVMDQTDGTSTVQLVACHRDVIDRHLALLREVGLEPAVITPSSWGLLAWYRRLAASESLQEPVMVIHVDTHRTDFGLIDRGRLLFSRSLSQGLQAWQAGQESMGSLAQELGWSLASLRKELPDLKARTVLLTGLGPLEQWKGFLEEGLGKPVVVKHPPAGASRAPVEASAAVAMGLAMADLRWLVNLLPPEARQAQRQRRWIRQLTLTGLLLAASLVLGTGVLGVLARRQERLVAQTMQQVRQLEAATDHTEQQADDLQAVTRIFATRRDTAVMLAELFRRSPPELMFETLLLERPRGELVLRGYAPTTRQVLDYIRDLEQAGQWERVELRYSAQRNIEGQARTDFEIVLRLAESSA